MAQAIQFIDSCRDEAEARQVAAGLATQDGLLAVRILAPGIKSAEWRIQALFESDGNTAGWLPDGCRRVTLLDGTLESFRRQPLV